MQLAKSGPAIRSNAAAALHIRASGSITTTVGASLTASALCSNRAISFYQNNI